jgi:hypothetical protein
MDLVQGLEELGLTRNQSLAYLTLAADSGGEGLTGYEVGARSGVPRSAVYKVLQQLEELGVAFAVGQEPQRFVATSPEDWIGTRRRRALAHYDEVESALRTLPRPSRPEPIWVVRSYGEVIARATELVASATHTVALSAWRREIELLRPVLSALRGVHGVLHCPEALPDPIPGWSCWTDELDGGKGHWSHSLLLVVDRRAALMGGAEPGRDNDAVHTTNGSVVDVAVNHVIRDPRRHPPVAPDRAPVRSRRGPAHAAEPPPAGVRVRRRPNRAARGTGAAPSGAPGTVGRCRAPARGVSFPAVSP